MNIGSEVVYVIDRYVMGMCVSYEACGLKRLVS